MVGALTDPFYLTAAIAGGASMSFNSQNRIAVNQADSAAKRGQVLAAVVAHEVVSTKRPIHGMRRTRLPLGRQTSMYRDSMHPSTDGHLSQPASCRHETPRQPRLWASLVLSKLARG